MATMASGVHKRPPQSQVPDEPELPATFTGEDVDEDDLSTMAAEYGDPFEDLKALPENAPTEISGFVIKGMIAQGGMGAVYLAMQRRPRRPVAIKVIKAGVASPMALKRFEFEALRSDPRVSSNTQCPVPTASFQTYISASPES